MTTKPAIPSRNSWAIRLCFLTILSVHGTLGVWGASQKTFTEFVEEQDLRPLPPSGLRIIAVDGIDVRTTLVAQLDDQDPDVRLFAAKQIYELSSTEFNVRWIIPQLAFAVTNRDVVVRRHVTAAFIRLGEKSYEAAPSLLQGLADEDALVRRNSIACLGSIGPSAAFAVPALTKMLTDSDSFVRAYTARALGNIREGKAVVIPELVHLLDDENALVRTDAIQALGNFGADALESVPDLTHLYEKAADPEQRLTICQALAEIALGIHDQAILGGLPALKKAWASIASMKNGSSRNCSLTIERAIKYLELLPKAEAANAIQRKRIPFASPIPPELAESDSLLLNGEPAEIRAANSKADLFYLGNETVLDRGLNWITTKRKAFLFWLEENKLKQFNQPYTNSFALIVAIDDYGRANDLDQRGPTGYRPLSFMVDHAKALTYALQDLGFPKENIIELYNSAATSSNIAAALNGFWEGGDLSRADRLFFYFGGHGDKFGQTASLITYDFDRKRPALTSLLMRDLTGRHFENVAANHVLTAIDSCHAGLAVPQLLDPHLDEERLRAFRTLSIVQSETEKPARNLLVSGTGDEKALWENGGIFTEALVSGLGGKADFNDDGVIQFEELALFLRNEVRARALQTGVRQEPDHWKADRFGRGGVVFLRNRKSPKARRDVKP